MKLNKHLIIHIAVVVGVCSAIVYFGVVFRLYGYAATFIFAGSLISTIYELGSRGHTFSKRKFMFNSAVLISSLLLFISCISPTYVDGLNIQPLIAGGDPSLTANMDVRIYLPSEAYGTFNFRVVVRNVGQVTLKGVDISVEIDQDIEIKSEPSTFLGNIEPNQQESAQWELYCKDEGVKGITVKVDSDNAGVNNRVLQITIDQADSQNNDTNDNSESDPEFNEYDTDAQEMFAVMFSEVLSASMTGLTLIFIVLGTILIIMGDAQDSQDLYGVGAFAAAVPTAITIFSLFFGWAEPSEYFVTLAGASMAGFAQAIVTLVVLMLVLNIAFMFDDVIGSALER
jgi:hypothetical protein